MTSLEFTESLAFERLEPDPARETVRLLGLIAQTLVNVNRDRDAHPDPYDFDDFVPDPYGIPKAVRLAEYQSTVGKMRQAAAKRRAERVH